MSESLRCVNHPNVETYLRCNKCGRPMCSKCAVRTPVGYRCRECINAQQQVFYADFRPVHYLVAAAVALPLALVAGWLVSSLGWYVIVLGPLAGGGIAEVSRWATRRRRGQHTWLVVCGCVVVGALPKLFFLLVGLAVSPAGAAHVLMDVVWAVIYLSAATGTAYALLRSGRRM